MKLIYMASIKACFKEKESFVVNFCSFSTVLVDVALAISTTKNAIVMKRKFATTLIGVALTMVHILLHTL